MEILFIGFGGFIGAIARYYLGNFVQDYFNIHNFPIGILFVNILGCFLIGLLTGIIDNIDSISGNLKSLLFIGILGSFTTFSTFSQDTLKLLMNGEILSALINVTISVFFGLLFVWIGYKIPQLF